MMYVYITTVVLTKKLDTFTPKYSLPSRNVFYLNHTICLLVAVPCILSRCNIHHSTNICGPTSYFSI